MANGLMPPGWIEILLRDLGAPATADNIAYLNDWAVAEHGSGGSWGGYDQGGAYNPFDTGLREPGSSNYNNLGGGFGVQDYTNWQEGIQATVATLQQSNMAPLLNALRSGTASVSQLEQAEAQTPWGQEAGWPSGAVAPTSGSPGSSGGFQPGDTGSFGGESQAQQNANAEVPYTGANAYKGFDLGAIPGPDRARAEQTINQYLANPADQAQVEGEIQRLYGFTSWLFDIPSVKTIMIVGTLEHWSPDAIFGAVQQTQWWQTHDANQRYWAEIQGSDPATAQEALNSARAAIMRTAATIGLPANYFSGQELSAMAEVIASNSIGSNGSIPDTGFTQDQITRMVASAYQYRKGQAVGGDIATLQDDYRKLAGQYMIPQSEEQIGIAAQNAIQNDYNQLQFVRGSESAYENMLKQQAIAKYPYMAEMINAGITPWQWADSYRQTAGQILEVNPYQVDLEGKFGWALNQTNDKGQKVPMSLADFSRELMSNPVYGYQYTNKAVNAAWTNASQILDALGAVPAPAGF